MSSRSPAVRRGRVFAGRFTPPGDKSITHRAALFGLLADGTTVVRDGNPGEDCGRSLRAAAALGARVSGSPAEWSVTGPGHALVDPKQALDCGNSGTSIRLLAGILAGQSFDSKLFGDASLSRRPMARVLEPLRRMGASIESGDGGRPPLTIRGGDLHGVAYASPVASAQIATCVLLAGLLASGETSVHLPGPARDHTERMLPAFGVPLDVLPERDGGRRITVTGGSRLQGLTLRVAGDASAAAFFLAAAAALPGAEVTAAGMNVNPTRTGLLDVLAEMGATVTLDRAGFEAGEPFADVTVRGPDRLRAFDVPPAWIPRLVDEVPAWIVAASAASGTSRIRGAAELRVKESDRIAALCRNLGACGIRAREYPDGLDVDGGTPAGARIETDLDHRIVMAFAVLGTRTDRPMTFDDTGSVATSYPEFFATLAALGAEVA